jgi:hypothetical protein
MIGLSVLVIARGRSTQYPDHRKSADGEIPHTPI